MEKYIIVSIVLIISAFIYLKLAIKFKIIDKPNERSSHSKITVRGGGIIFPIATLLFFFLNDFQYPYVVLGVVLIAFISFLDDIYTLSSKVRFPFQILAITLVLLELNIPVQFLFFFYLLWGIGVINMFNFMDGINGITGLYSLSSLFGFYLINTETNFINPDLIIFTAISLVVFGFFNFRKKALFFAGDIGSIVIGMLIFFLGILFIVRLSSPFMLVLIMVYGADSGMTLLYRFFFTKESILDPHRHHAYQKLVDVYKMSHLHVSAIYGTLQLLISCIAFKTYNLEATYKWIVFLSLSVLLIMLYCLIFKGAKKKTLAVNKT